MPSRSLAVSLFLALTGCGASAPRAAPVTAEPPSAAPFVVDEATRARVRERVDAVVGRWVADGVAREHIRTRPIGEAVVLLSIEDPERLFEGGESEPLGTLVAPDGELDVEADVLAEFTYPNTCDSMGVRRVEVRVEGEPLSGIATITGGLVAMAFTAVHGPIEAARAECGGSLELSPSICGDVVLCRDGILRPVARIVDGAPRAEDTCLESLITVADEIATLAREGQDRVRDDLANWGYEAAATYEGCDQPEAAVISQARQRITTALGTRGDALPALWDTAVVGCLQPNGEFWIELSDIDAPYRAVWWARPASVEEMLVQPEEFVGEDPLAAGVDFDGDDVPELVAAVLGENGVALSYCPDDLVVTTFVRGARGTASVSGEAVPYIGEGGPGLLHAGHLLRWTGTGFVEVADADAELRAQSLFASDMRGPYETVLRIVLSPPNASPEETCANLAGAWPLRLRDALYEVLFAEAETAAALASRASGCDVPLPD